MKMAMCIQVGVPIVSFLDAGLIQARDVKPDNVFVNLQEGDMRFSDVQLGDLGGCYPDDSKWATGGTMTGTAIWASPEVLMELPWNTASDIWAFGTLVRTISHRYINHLFPYSTDRLIVCNTSL
jgi:serine/threonine protein kinase